MVGVRAVSHSHQVDSKGALGRGDMGGAAGDEEYVRSVFLPAPCWDGWGSQPVGEGFVCHFLWKVSPPACIHEGETVAHVALGYGCLDEFDSSVVPGDVGGVELGVGAPSQDVAGSILIVGAVGAVAGGGREWVSTIGLAVAVCQFPGPKVSPSGLEDLDLLSPGVC